MIVCILCLCGCWVQSVCLLPSTYLVLIKNSVPVCVWESMHVFMYVLCGLLSSQCWVLTNAEARLLRPSHSTCSTQNSHSAVTWLTCLSSHYLFTTLFTCHSVLRPYNDLVMQHIFLVPKSHQSVIYIFLWIKISKTRILTFSLHVTGLWGWVVMKPWTNDWNKRPC